MDTDQALQDRALDHVRELLSAHWREARDSADEDGKFSIGFRVIFERDAVPAKIKVICRIARIVTDEAQSEVDAPEQMQLL